MQFGFILPFGDARTAAELAHIAEMEGWDGFFMWEPVWGIDPWVGLAAAAMRTSTIRLGTMLTPLPIRKPWKLASETATLDNLSGGRLILSVGLGAPETGFARFGEDTDRKRRAARLDEGLHVLTGLWAGQPFSFEGEYYHLQPTDFSVPPPPVQQPRIPIWVVGAYPSHKSMQRALRYDGLIPNVLDAEGKAGNVTLEALPAIAKYVREHRANTDSYQIIAEGLTSGSDRPAAAAKVQPWQDAGATWWLESNWEEKDFAAIAHRVRQGPPRYT